MTDVSAIWATSFQWYQNGVAVPGANAEILAMPNATQASSGYDFCRVANACGAVDSNQVYIQIRASCDVLYVDGSRPYPGGDGLSWGSAFWNVSGVNLKGSILKGVEVDFESLRALVTGGVEFASPPGSARAKAGTVYFLHANPKKEWLAWAPQIKIAPAEK